MGSSSSNLGPQELSEFRKLKASLENVEIPALPENRKITDKKGFFFLGVGFLILLPFLICSFTKADFRHFTSGVDDCGNFCGHKNSKIKGLDCSGIDYTTKPFEYKGECVETCLSGQSVAGRCLYLSNNDYIVVINDGLEASGKVWWKYILTILATIALSTLTLMLLRFLPGAAVRGIIYLSMALLIIVTGLIWNAYLKTTRINSLALLVVAVVWTIFAAILLVIFVALFKRIGLVVQLYNEAAKVLKAMPLLVPLTTSMLLVQITVWVVFAILTISTLSAREFYKTYDGGIYEMSGIMVFTSLMTIFFAIWTVKFVSGTYYMTVSGSVGAWFFTSREYLVSPIATGFGNTVKYHLGTVTFGSFLLTLFSAVKSLMQTFLRIDSSSCFACCSCAELLFNFVSENSYTETALHGQPYIKSVKRATKLLLQNAKSVIVLTCIGDFVLGIIVVIVTILATGISYFLFEDVGLLPVFICFIFNFVIVAMTFSTFQIIIQSLFICFCEDSVLNDGVSRPYYMSKGLMEFVNCSKRNSRRLN